MKSIFLDTNIVLDILDSERKNHAIAKQLLEKIVIDEYSVTISEDMLSTIFYIIKDKQAVLHFFETILQHWTITSFGKATVSKAVTLCLENKGQDFEDTLQCLSAKASLCDAIITHDKRFIDCGVKVLTIETFLAY